MPTNADNDKTVKNLVFKIVRKEGAKSTQQCAKADSYISGSVLRIWRHSGEDDGLPFLLCCLLQYPSQKLRKACIIWFMLRPVRDLGVVLKLGNWFWKVVW